MKKITKEAAEAAITAYLQAKIKEADIKGSIKDAEEIIEAYSRENLESFSDGRMAMDNGIIAIRAGAAKPMKEGKALTTAARSELASALPAAYVKYSCEFSVLYDCTDKTVRQLLKSRGIEIVRDDKFVIL